MQADDWKWLGGWGKRIGLSAYGVFFFGFMTGHPQPWSYDSLVLAASAALLPALSGTALLVAVLIYWRSR